VIAASWAKEPFFPFVVAVQWHTDTTALVLLVLQSKTGNEKNGRSFQSNSPYREAFFRPPDGDATGWRLSGSTANFSRSGNRAVKCSFSLPGILY
jgi:hypothetical protein